MDGGAVSIHYVFSTTTTDADPGNGFLRLDNATQESATTIFADLVDSLGTNVTDILDAFNLFGGINSVGLVRLSNVVDPTKWIVWIAQVVLSPSGYRQIVVIPVDASGSNPFVNADVLALTFTPTGETGAAGNNGLNGTDATQFPNFRLTLVSNNPVGVATSVSTIYYAPYFGNKISLYVGGQWVTRTSSQISVAVPSTKFRIFNIYVYDNSGTPTLETEDWNNATTGTITAATNATPIVCTSNSHGLNVGDIVGIDGIGGNTALNGEIWQVSVAGTNSFTLRGSSGNGAFSSNGTWTRISSQTNPGCTLQDGVPVKTSDPTRRYVGIGMTDGVSGQISYATKRGGLTNLYNQIDSVLTYFDTTSHTLGATGTRPWNNDGKAYISYLVPYGDAITEVGSCHPIIFHSATTGSTNVGFGNQNNNTLNRYVVSTTSTSAQRYGCTGFTQYTEGFSWSGIVEDRLSASTANFTQVVAQVRVKR